MPKYDRIKLEITDLSLKSASMVFEFLDTCLESEELNVTYFKNNIGNYSIAENHFIFHYAKQYFSSSQRSYLNRWMENQLGKDYQVEQSSNYASKIFEGAEEILDYVRLNEKRVERQYKVFKKKDLYIYVKSNPINYRIPLYFKNKTEKKIIERLSVKEISLESFKMEAKTIFLEVMESEEFNIFFSNSFDYVGNIYPIEELNLEFEKSDTLYATIHRLYDYYNDVRNKQNEILSYYYQKLIDERLNPKDPTKKPSEIRAKFILSQKIPNIQKVGRLEFMKIMYNAFPQIRDSYYLYLRKNPNASLDSYLRTKSRNIK